MEWTFPWAVQRMWVIQKWGAMVRPSILVVVNIERFSLCKDYWHPFQSYRVIFEAIVQFSIFILFLVQIIWRQFEQGFKDIAQLPLSDVLNKHFPSLFQLICFQCLSFHIGLTNYLYFILSEVCSLGKFQLFVFVCSGFLFLFIDYVKTFASLIRRKSCCWPGFLVIDAKDAFAYLAFGLKC
jgi:hypothetical protein